MKNLLGLFKLNVRVGKIIAISSFFIFAGVIAAAPRQAAVTKAEGCTIYDHPIFNPFPVTWDANPPAGCNDFAVIAGGVHGSGQWSDNFNANPGDTITLRVYLHNGAATGSGQVMHDVQYNVNLDTNTGSTHTVSAQLTASNADSKSGAITINTPADSRLELVSGDLQHTIGDQQPCFDYSQAFFITVRVVSNAPTITGQNKITAAPDSVCLNDSLIGGNVSWTNSSDVKSVEVTVEDKTANDHVATSITGLIGTTNWHSTTNYLRPGHTYAFVMYNTSNSGQHDVLDQVTEQVPNLTCGSPAITGQNKITATPDSVCLNDSLIGGNVSWINSSDVQSVEVTVEDQTANDHVISSVTGAVGPTNWHSTTNYLRPGHTYVFVMYNTTGGKHDRLDQTTEQVPNLTCGPTVTGRNKISATPNSVCLANGLVGGNISWTNSSDIQSVEVTIEDQTANDHVVSSITGSIGATNWQSTTNYLRPGHVYAIVMYNTTGGRHDVLDQITEQVPNLTCSTPEASKVSLTLNASSFCVYSRGEKTNDTAIYTVTGSSDLANQQIIWSSSKGSDSSHLSSTGESNDYYGQNLSSGNPPSWTGAAVRSWNTSDIGSWTKTASIFKNGQIAATSQPFSFTVKDCSQTVQNVVCVASPTLINVGQSATFTASNGDGNYSWTVNGGSVTSTSQKSFSSTFNAPGTYIATVNSAGGPNTCSVQVIQPVCQPNTNFALNAATPVKTGSTYSVQLTWSSTGSNQVKVTQINPGSGSEVAVTVGAATGNFTVTGLQPGSNYIFKLYDAGCGTLLTSTSVNTPSNPGQLVCSANVSSANIGEDVIFTTTGGNAPYTWATSNNSNAGSGSSFKVNFASGGNKSVTVTSSDNQTANCGVIINTPVQQPAQGNCNNSSDSCNHTVNNSTSTDIAQNSNNTNTNNNHQTSTGNNSANQNNQNNVNGNNNTITNTNNNCVNNSCNTTNTVYITSAGNTVQPNQYAQLSITKSVRSLNNGGSFQNSVSVNNGDAVQFEIVVTNSGSATANNVRLTDSLPSGLSLINGTVQVNGNTVSDSNLSSGYLGTLANGQSSRIDFQARVNGNNGASIQNIASATSDNAGTVQASAWVFTNNGSVLGGNVNLLYSKRALNETKNADATSVNASREDFITYTLTVSNSGNSPANNFIITDDLSQVLPYADMVDNGGGSLNGNVISYPGITVPAGGSVSRSFKVRVKYALADNLSYVMTNTYGNTLTIRINNPQVLGAFIAPKTGADTNAWVFSGLLTGVAAVFKKRKSLLKVIFT